MKKFNSLEDIASSFNISIIIQQFNQQCQQKTGSSYFGELITILYKRKDTKHVIQKLGVVQHVFLSGKMPTPSAEDITEYDFMLTPLLRKDQVIDLLKDIEPEVWVFTIITSKIGEDMQVGLRW